VIDIFKKVDLAGKDGIVSEFSPGVFLQVILRLFMFLMTPDSTRQFIYAELESICLSTTI